jgi:hypothetical protein
MHVCSEGHCEVEKNEQGHDICIVTGMCVKMLNFSNEEFVETACVSDIAGLDDIFEKQEDSAAVHDRDGHNMSENTSNKKARIAGDFNTVHASSKQQQHLQNKKEPSSNASPAATTCHGGVRMDRCSVNKKNRYRSWVYHRVMHNHMDNRRGSRSSARASLSQVQSLSASATRESPRGNMCSSWAVLSRDAIKQTTTSCAQTALQSSSGIANSIGHSAGAHQQCAEGSQYPTVSATKPVADSQGRIRNLIHMYVWDIMCSSKWENSMRTEVPLSK